MLTWDPAVEREHVYARARRELAPYLPDFAGCGSMRELHELPSYRQAAGHVRTLLDTLDTGDFRGDAAPARPAYRVVAWNIERGKQLTGQLRAFRANTQLRDADVILLVESDLGMARSGNVNIARTMARELGMSYAFAPCYFSLVKGSGVEYHVEGENELGLHGNAVLSRYPMGRVQAIPLVNGVDKMRGREKRLGRQAAVAAEIEFPDGAITAVSVHLDMQSSQRHRCAQMRSILGALPGGPAIVGGDWNTSTYDSSHAFFAIAGFWLRVLMGVDNVIRNHYLHPERFFERELFRMLESRGFDYRECNLMGERTTYYDIADAGAWGSLNEWVPAWTLKFIRWALRKHDGKCPFKLDWLATRGLRAAVPFVIHDHRDLSDHDPIGVDLKAVMSAEC